ncbi:MAG: MFS transporter [Verrucomicrobia bacterium Tous-C9LFEB]|nr:MAG: MFS transporter [Verrucomicrobia bacterium Tous-C9LFEB]
MSTGQTPHPDFTPERERLVYAKVIWRIIPVIFLCYVVAYLDRVNVGFAKLQMLSDLKWSDTIYGFGAGIFFIGYFLFEVPSNIMLHKVGARPWIATIMIIWGFLSVSTMFVKTPMEFYVLRFFLGIAESGFFPGVILYFTYWFPPKIRAQIGALFMTAIALSGVIGSPVSGWIIQNFHNVNGWNGWQWLFLLEGLPSVLMGLVVLACLDNRIDDAKWLTAEEKALLDYRIAEGAKQHVHLTTMQVFGDRRIWFLSLLYFLFIMGLYGISFWLPQIIKNTGVKDVFNIGLLSMIPYGIAAVSMVLFSKIADKNGTHRRYLAASAFAGSAGLILCGIFANNVVFGMAALTLATVGVLTMMPLFWTLPTAFLGGTAAAAGIAVINSFGNLAGFVSPYMIGAITDATKSSSGGLYVIAVCLALFALLVLWKVKKPA